MTSASPTAGAIADGVLHLDAVPVLRGLAAGWSTVDDATGAGVFLRAAADAAACFLELPLGRLAGLERFTSVHRFSPFWTRPALGTRDAEVRPETLWLLARRGDGGHTLLVPLLDGATRYSLRGTPDGLAVVAETGDPAVLTDGGVALFVASGGDPYALMGTAARAVQHHLGSGALRADKPLPDTVDLFGWCTWDAFYKDVTPEGVLAGLAGFAQGGVEPRLLILDDGWQTWQTAPGGEERLTRLAPNARFGGDLAALVQASKTQFKVQRFFVWHALLGYWGGLCEQALPGYGTRTVARAFGPGLLEQEPRWNVGPWGAQAGVPAAGRFGAFYEDLHAGLARQGVDGVKVDVQALLEGLSTGQGGRVTLARAVRRALEDAVRRHFDGRLINCMSCTQECVYLAADSTLLRSSDDFFPQRPASHGVHLHANALVGLWFGEFMQPDWDMFQSAHARGAFHAAARAVSGGPVYVSDRVGEHDFELLRRLVLSDGRVLRADDPGRPTPDCLFADPTREPVLLKVFNRNRDCGVVGLFNARHGADEVVAGTVAAADVPTLAPGDYVAHAQRADRLWRCGFDERAPLGLAEGEWELVSFAPLEHGFAALGLADKFNGTGAIAARRWQDGACHLDLRDGGRFLAWAAHAPAALDCDGAPLAFAYDAASGRLDADAPVGGPRTLVVRWR